MNLWWLLLAYAWGGPTLVPVRTVNYDFELGGIYFDALFLEKDTFVASFQKDAPLVATPDGTVRPIRPRGRGPGDIEGAFAYMRRGDDLVLVTETGRFKAFSLTSSPIFEPRGEVVFQEPARKIVFVHDAALVDGKFVVAGFGSNFGGKQMDLVNIFHADGTFYRNAVPLEADGAGGRQIFYEACYLVPLAGTEVLYLREDALAPVVFDVHAPGTRTIELARPPGYVPMGDTTFRKPPEKRPKSVSSTIALWRAQYSSVTNVLRRGGLLVVQVRTPERPTRFVTRWYDLASWEPRGDFPGNDFLLGVWGDELYFYENGEPGQEDDAGPMRLHVMRMEL